jgi:hypothetical protein
MCIRVTGQPSSHACAWERACFAQDDHAVITSDVTFHQDLVQILGTLCDESAKGDVLTL